MNFTQRLPIALATLFIMATQFVSAQVQEGQMLEPELGIYVEIDEEQWGAAQINLRIVNNNFQLYFLDAEGLLVKPPIDKVIVHYGNFIKDSNAKETLLLEKQDMMLTSPRVIPPPHRYMVRIFLKKIVEPEEYYKEPYEVKEFIGMHILNQLGGDLLQKTQTQPTSVEPPAAEGEEKAENEEQPVAEEVPVAEGTPAS